jgi:protein SCO1/2
VKFAGFFSNVTILVTSIAFLSGCSDPASKLPNYGHIPEFTMTDADGRAFTNKDLAGKVWIVDFIYTNCPAECPRMSSQMRRLAERLKNEADVRLLSISVDPARDTPPVLKAFAHRYGGANEQWVFLTGTPDTVHRIAYETFHVGDVLGKIEHSTKFIAVDKRGNLRGYYSSVDADGIPSLLRDVAALKREKVS